MTPEQQTAEDYRQLQDEYQQLKADYEQLCLMFDNMGQGYEEALNLYDKAVESSRMKTDFIQQISHEIRTPLNILSGFTQILTSGMELDDATKTEVGQGICENTQRITGLVNKMLELAEAGSDAEIERTDDVLAVQIAAQAADESQITMAQHLNFDLQFSPEAEMAMIHTNLQQATRVLVLLLDNAMKFTHPAEAAGGAAAVKEKAHVILSVDITPSSPNPSSFSSPSSSSSPPISSSTVSFSASMPSGRIAARSRARASCFSCSSSPSKSRTEGREPWESARSKSFRSMGRFLRWVSGIKTGSQYSRLPQSGRSGRRLPACRKPGCPRSAPGRMPAGFRTGS